MEYPQFLMDHFQNPRNVGEIADADGTGIVKNATCGDIMQMSIKVKEDVIVDAKFKTFGCGAAIATSSVITEKIKGKGIEEALRISDETAKEILSQLPPEKFPCFTLAANALKLAVEEYRCNKREIHEKGGIREEDLEKGLS
ncbi:MAG: iron-sulfur cluster assembly scaffold protein [Deltaproteobacteria bacterium]|nr:iron-sulfur cluster assembly scaffold protein [Deltaproteobacteria bacterium]